MGKVVTYWSPPTDKKPALREIAKQINFMKSEVVGEEKQEKFEKVLIELRKLWKMHEIERMVKLLHENQYLYRHDFELLTISPRGYPTFELVVKGWG